jgi:hypothetical protein
VLHVKPRDALAAAATVAAAVAYNGSCSNVNTSVTHAMPCFQATVLLWEQLRPKTTTEEARNKLVSLIISKVTPMLQHAPMYLSVCCQCMMGACDVSTSRSCSYVCALQPKA